MPLVNVGSFLKILLQYWKGANCHFERGSFAIWGFENMKIELFSLVKFLQQK